LLTPGVENRFLNDFLPFQRRVARIGLWNGLGQTLLKLACPGVPDIYQGNELWDFSLVDPDNRRPVDYAHRQQMFHGICKSGKNDTRLIGELTEAPEDGRIKLYLIWKTLCLRRQFPDLFQMGEYLPLTVEGTKADHVVAFARKSESSTVLVVVPRLVAGLLGDVDLPPIGPQVWEDTQILLPFCGSATYRNAFTEEVLNLRKGDGYATIALSTILANFPVALCSEEHGQAGVLSQ
jgi:(1->4)-alpha-D-glucan 1-alpha-D-glucosylmutase